MKESLKSLKESCFISGHSLMTDARLDQKQKSLMNIIVHYLARTTLHSRDALDEKHDASYIYKFVDETIKDATKTVLILASCYLF